MNANLYALLAAHFPESAEQPCLLIPDGPVIHYDDLDAASARIAHALTAAGARPGDRVAAQVDKCWEVLALYLACLRAGFVYLPLNTGYQKSELSYLFGDAEPSVIVCGPQFAERNAALRPEAQVLTLASGKGTLLDRADERPETFDTVVSKPDDVAAILYTSGTTGRPKGAMLTHRNLASNALTLVQLWGFTRGDVLLHALPIYHVHGLFVACHCALLSGARMLWLAKFDAEEVRALLPRATAMMGVPTFYTRLLALPAFGAADCRSVRLFVSGSAPLLAETFDEFRAADRAHDPRALRNDRNGNDHVESARRRADRAAPSAPRSPGFRCASSMPKAAPAPPGDVGGVEVHGPNVFAGYWRMPDKTREEFTADAYFRTGDMGELPAERLSAHRRPREGSHHHRRAQRLSQGNRGEDRCAPGVVESAVIGVPDADFGEAVAAVVVAQSGHTLTEAGVIAALRDEIARFKVPKHVQFVTELPRNAMGKVQKNLLARAIRESR